jgi:hypothetical protein
MRVGYAAGNRTYGAPSTGQFNRLGNFQRIILLATMLLAWWLRLVELAKQDIWWDEARNIDVALRPFWQIPTAPELDIHPPVYFWLLHIWGRMNSLQMGMAPVEIAYVTRLLSVLAGVASVALLYALASRCAPSERRQWAGVLAALMGALSPFWLAESQETRMYTVGFALLTGAAVVLLAALKQSVRGRFVWFVLLSALALLTHYNAVFIVAAWYVGWLVWALAQRDRWGALRTMLLCGVATVVLVAPIAPVALRQIPVYANPNLTVPTIAEYLSQNWQAYWGGYAFNSLDGGMARVALWVSAAIGALGLLVAWLRSAQKTPLALLLVWLFGGLALYYIAVLDRGAFNVRYSSFITPALYALFGVAIASVGALWRALSLIGAALALAIWPQAIYADLYDERYAREDIGGVTRWLRSEAQPGAVIFVDQKYPFGFYYERYAIDPAQTPTGREIAPARYLFVDINTIDRRLQEWAADATEVYWVQWFESDTDPRRAVAFLLDQQGERAGEQNFQGYSIDWWKLTPPNEFVLAPNLQAIEVRFASVVRTVAVSLPEEPVGQGANVPVTIRWQREGGALSQPLKARVALYAPDGSRISQRDERLLNDRHLMPSEWTLEDQPLNVYLLEVPSDLAPGVYDIGLLVYDADTLGPLDVLDEAGNASGIETVIGSVEIVEGEP